MFQVPHEVAEFLRELRDYPHIEVEVTQLIEAGHEADEDIEQLVGSDAPGYQVPMPREFRADEVIEILMSVVSEQIIQPCYALREIPPMCAKLKSDEPAYFVTSTDEVSQLSQEPIALSEEADFHLREFEKAFQEYIEDLGERLGVKRSGPLGPSL